MRIAGAVKPVRIGVLAPAPLRPIDSLKQGFALEGPASRTNLRHPLARELTSRSRRYQTFTPPPYGFRVRRGRVRTCLQHQTVLSIGEESDLDNEAHN